MKNAIYSFSIIVISAVIFAGCYSSSPATSSNRYSAPDWAPMYEPGVRYYYLPDIETYYDVTSGNFIYFDHGQWLYSPQLPPAYRGYDLYNGYSVILDRRVYQPWRYHQNYVSSYPRYYYRDTYGNQNSGTVRGYNENERKPVHMTPSDRARRNSTTSPATPEINSGSKNESRSSDYSNRRVGQPVKVTPEMREPRQSSSSSSSTGSSRRQSSSVGTGTGTGSGDNNDANVRQRKSSSSAPPPSARRSNDGSARSSDAKAESGNSTDDKRPSRRR